MSTKELGMAARRAQDLRSTAEIVAAYVRNRPIAVAEVPSLIAAVLNQVSNLGEPVRPAVPVHRSINDAYLICLEDGRRVKRLRFYIKKHFGMSEHQYRAKWGLNPDYPMTAPGYSRRASAEARAAGLGRHAR